jgi:hypothetical protein
MKAMFSVLTSVALFCLILAGCGQSQPAPVPPQGKPAGKQPPATAPVTAPKPDVPTTKPAEPTPAPANPTSPAPVVPAPTETPKPPPPPPPAAEKPAEPKAGDDAVLYWKFDDGKGAAAADASGKRNDGAITGEAAWVEGKVKGAISFPEGKECYAAIANVNGIAAGNTAHTIAAWVKVAKLPENRAWILLLGSEGEGSHHWLINNAGETQFGVWGGNQAKPALAVGQWKHVAITFDGKNLTGYLDGQKTESTEATFNLQGVPLTVAQTHNGENGFEGQVDDLRVYARALSDKEVADLAQAK